MTGMTKYKKRLLKQIHLNRHPNFEIIPMVNVQVNAGMAY